MMVMGWQVYTFRPKMVSLREA
ncbi:putative DUF3180 domain-containing protein [Aeromonas phage LAh3]|nr:putative DUF3180 domain-containing protein [Aeromonas phage LAh3]QDH46424.1 putative DUF3180 domain-containing protein [Aeromonas phage LAh4]QDH46477.1 putative DUF3180 domain-containing protein [Aeromonas phage LAh5]